MIDDPRIILRTPCTVLFVRRPFAYISPSQRTVRPSGRYKIGKRVLFTPVPDGGATAVVSGTPPNNGYRAILSPAQIVDYETIAGIRYARVDLICGHNTGLHDPRPVDDEDYLPISMYYVSADDILGVANQNVAGNPVLA